jgi:hypothetical protein
MRRIAIFAVPLLLLTTAAQRPATPPARTAPSSAVPAPTIPTRVTAKMLSDLCAQDRGACLGYVIGSTDSWASALAAAGRPQVVCIPAGANNDQITQATVRYIRARPQEGGVNAAVVIFAALKASFPCGY